MHGQKHSASHHWRDNASPGPPHLPALRLPHNAARTRGPPSRNRPAGRGVRVKMSAVDFRQRLLPILLTQAVGLACGIAGVKLVSHIVDPADYGAYGVFVSLAAIGVGVIYAGLIKFVSRYWQTAADRGALLRELLVASLRRAPWLVAASACAALLIAPSARPTYGVLLCACAFLLALTQLAQSALQAAREHWRDLGVATGMSVTRSFLPPVLYAASGAGLEALLLGFSLQALVGVLLGAWNVRPWWRGGHGPTRAPILTPVYDGPRFVVLAVAGWTLLGMNRWLVAWRFGTETAGYFTLAANIGAILPTVLGAVLLQYFQPHWFGTPPASHAARQKLLADVDRVALGYTVLSLLLVVGLDRCMPLLVGPLVSERYSTAAAFVLATGCAAASFTIGNFYHAMLLAAQRERACTLVDLSGAAILVLGSAVSAFAGLEWFKRWLLVSPLMPWLINRSLARRAVLKPA